MDFSRFKQIGEEEGLTDMECQYLWRGKPPYMEISSEVSIRLSFQDILPELARLKASDPNYETNIVIM